jgi:hypothetical protein
MPTGRGIARARRVLVAANDESQRGGAGGISGRLASSACAEVDFREIGRSLSGTRVPVRHLVSILIFLIPIKHAETVCVVHVARAHEVDANRSRLRLF